MSQIPNPPTQELPGRTPSPGRLSLFPAASASITPPPPPPPPTRDLRANTEYQGYSSAAPVVRWFWEAVGEMNAEDQALLLQFATGTSKVPLEGFRALQGIGGPQKFQIHKVWGEGGGG